ncbi:MAG: hypothetical protein H0W88_11100 [Parachlamydiaceae bacterium]|nr:hypothetical protein [Parachlamydiaceae bacterium]
MEKNSFITNENRSSSFCDPTSILQAAIKQIEIFTTDSTSLDIGENGQLVAKKSSGLEKAIELTRQFIGPLFFSQIRQDQAQKISHIKKELLHARDIIQSHLLLIEKLNNGDSSQKKIAHWALETITSYNTIISNHRSSVGGFERNQLLQDAELAEISLPYTVSLKYNSDPNAHLIHKAIQNVSEVLTIPKSPRDYLNVNPTHKKSLQVMIDSFHLKAIRKIQEVDQLHTLGEFVNLIKQAPVEIDEEKDSHLTVMRQKLEIAPGSTISLVGSFKKHMPDAKLMSIPILDTLHVSIESTQTGFPYPSQYVACAWGDPLVNINPIRPEQTPLFSALEDQKKQTIHGLLYDHNVLNKSKQLFKMNKDTFDKNATVFIQLHRDLYQSIVKASMNPPEDTENIINQFYEMVSNSSSSFDLLTLVQQQILDMTIHGPSKALQEAWLNGVTQLRIGSPNEKIQIAKDILNAEREKLQATLNPDNDPTNAFIHLMGNILGPAFQDITLLYMSEKIGYEPPELTEFQQKIQISAFHQLIQFLNLLNNYSSDISEEEMKSLLEKMMKDLINLFNLNSFNANDHSIAITQEVNDYLQSRFVVNQPEHTSE